MCVHVCAGDEMQRRTTKWRPGINKWPRNEPVNNGGWARERRKWPRAINDDSMQISFFGFDGPPASVSTLTNQKHKPHSHTYYKKTLRFISFLIKFQLRAIVLSHWIERQTKINSVFVWIVKKCPPDTISGYISPRPKWNTMYKQNVN